MEVNRTWINSSTDFISTFSQQTVEGRLLEARWRLILTTSPEVTSSIDPHHLVPSEQTNKPHWPSGLRPSRFSVIGERCRNKELFHSGDISKNSTHLIAFIPSIKCLLGDIIEEFCSSLIKRTPAKHLLKGIGQFWEHHC